ncbi:MAG: hypothetical protein AOA65_0266 [Candidatus Bathyarchaeota archaeon BA1]|nr:MAG: hypothetical protein AOA65_0266 [Candidatus Bathyarchaeota archaeon BA1]
MVLINQYVSPTLNINLVEMLLKIMKGRSPEPYTQPAKMNEIPWKALIKLYDKPNLQPYISNEYCKGDIRHCYADITKARKLLNYEPSISLEDGLTELAGWAKTHDGEP